MVEQTQAYSGPLLRADGAALAARRHRPAGRSASTGCSSARPTASCARSILATNFTNEGEATAHYIGELLRRARAQGQPPRPRRAGRRRARVRRQRHARAGAARAAADRRPEAAARRSARSIGAVAAPHNAVDVFRYIVRVQISASTTREPASAGIRSPARSTTTRGAVTRAPPLGGHMTRKTPSPAAEAATDRRPAASS